MRPRDQWATNKNQIQLESARGYCSGLDGNTPTRFGTKAHTAAQSTKQSARHGQQKPAGRVCGRGVESTARRRKTACRPVSESARGYCSGLEPPYAYPLLNSPNLGKPAGARFRGWTGAYPARWRNTHVGPFLSQLGLLQRLGASMREC
jgi:hypothetical protein